MKHISTKSIQARTATALAAAATLALSFPAPAHAERHGAYPIFATPEYNAKTGRNPQAEAANGTAGQMLYYGGSVFSAVKIVSVIWGPKVAAATVAGIPGFSAALVDSTYLDQLSPQYDTFLTGVNGIPGTNQHIGRGSFVTQVQITPKHTKKKLLDVDVQNELKYQIKQGVLPKNDLNTVYMVYFPRGVTIKLDTLTSCIDFSAYHFATSDLAMVKNNIFYSVEPDCGFSFDFITYAASHEFVEAVSDNIPTPGSVPAFPQAWNNSTGYEIGDLCGGSGVLTAPGRTYSVTQYYLNTKGACSTGNYTSP